MKTLALPAQTLRLERYPCEGERSPLQAWDAADEYLLTQPIPIARPLLILNDAFGALACALHAYRPVSVSDSLLSRLAAQQNLRLNGLDERAVTLLDSLSPLPAAPATVLIKLPKTLALLEHQLAALRQVVTPDSLIIAAGKATLITRSVLALFERYLGPVTPSLAWKKARLLTCRFSAPSCATPEPMLSWPVPERGWVVHNHASVFSRQSLDIGARFLLDHLPASLNGEVVDLGCGNGVLGMGMLQQNPDCQVTFIDESWMAIASARHNVSVNFPQQLERCRFLVNDALNGLPHDHYQAVICNPPFHQQHALTEQIAQQMFHQARQVLCRGGELRIVANRHLRYFPLLKRLFGHCQTVAANRKFVILRCLRRG